MSNVEGKIKEVSSTERSRHAIKHRSTPNANGCSFLMLRSSSVAEWGILALNWDKLSTRNFNQVRKAAVCPNANAVTFEFINIDGSF